MATAAALAALLAVPAQAQAEDVPGFTVNKIDGLSGLSLNRSRFPSGGTGERYINIEDCEAYRGGQIEVSVGVDTSLGNLDFTVAVAEPGGSCPTTNVEIADPSATNCTVLTSGSYIVLSGSSHVFDMSIDQLIFKGDATGCDGDYEEDAILYFLARYSDDQTTVYSSTVSVRVDLQRPSAPELTEVQPGDQRLEVVWDDPAADADTVEYTVYWKSGSALTESNKGSAHAKRGLSAMSYDIEENLTNSTQYSVGVTAVDDADNESPLSNTIDATPTPTTDFWEAYQQAGGTDTGGFCFIATVSYGTPLAAELDALRAFRDRVLMPSDPGRAFVAAYYTWGRFAAAWIADKPVLKAAARVLLVPLVWLAQLTTGLGGWATLLLLLSLGIAVVATRRRLVARILADVPPSLRAEVGR